jgi:hypothetical protein
LSRAPLSTAEVRANWFMDPTDGLFSRDPLRVTGPNRHLSDFSDASAVPPLVAPFPTQGPPVRACPSIYYNIPDTLLDSED